LITTVNSAMKTSTLLIPLLAIGTSLAAQEINALLSERAALEKTVWSQEQHAQKHEEAFVVLWDQLRQNSDELAILKAFDIGQLTWGALGTPQALDHGISLHKMTPVGGAGDTTLTREQWHAFLDGLAAQGLRMTMSEYHHRKFELKGDQPPESIVAFTLYLTNARTATRFVVDGTLRVIWRTEPDAKGVFMPQKLELTTMDIIERTGAPLFQNVGSFKIAPTQRGPLLAYDLNGDGRSELILPASNQVAWNNGGGYDLKLFAPARIEKVLSANLGDFNRDGHVDLIADATVEGSSAFYLFPGLAGGGFGAPQLTTITPAIAPLGPTMLTSGDIDKDGDLDLWLGVYKEPYKDGAMPTPYYDSNDGHPSFLLINQGDGRRFTEETVARGISEKRFRRVYSSSFFDRDNDGDLDLLVVCDFSGVDLYDNDGRGHFTDVTAKAFALRSLFGMAHAIADFNRDGRADIYATGMSSTTAARLQAMGARRQDFADRTDMRIPMTYGNRLYVSKADGGYEQPEYNKQMARTGWAWGTIAFDIDNDGDQEVYVANGHDSNSSAWDYCTSYWTDDIYRGDSIANPVMDQYFDGKFNDMERNGVSWNGFEKNFLYMPMSQGFIRNVSYLGDVAIEFDCRSVITDDIDADGRPDLIVDSQPFSYDPRVDSTTITIYRNQIPQIGNWVGVRLTDEAGAPLPAGTRISVTADGRTQSAFVINGDSYKAQHALTKHFGLGAATAVDVIEVNWIDGTVARLERPALNQYHLVKAKK
ncbi:MAG: enediyne biosynthesis protein, partial [Verrucomicrobiota bacterium]|nr:enediyne biosynthesis protein [Verrucomicrobiota bacterium]